VIKFENVVKYYGNSKALDGVNLDIHHGEFISLVGMSGAGKTTMFKILLGEESVDRGKVLIDGIDISEVRKQDMPLLRRRIGMVFQDMKLLPARTAYENVSFAMEVCGFSRNIIEKDVPKILSIVGLGHKAKFFPDQMSGGEKQRLAIARALSHRPVLLLADEPTGNLDEINAGEVLELLLKINRLGTTVILATHAVELVNKIKKKVITVKDGKIVREQEIGKYNLTSS